MMYSRGEVLLSLENVVQSYGDHEVLSNVSVRVHNLHSSDTTRTTGQVIAFLGPSGCGKTQLLRIISGLQRPTGGAVFIDPDRKPIKKGMCGVVFQRYPLFMHRTVLGNLVLAGKMAGLDNNTARTKSLELLENFKLGGSGAKYPGELSGGMQQRVAICQQLINMEGAGQTYTRLILMDEPFAALDPHNTHKTCKLIRKVADLHDTNTVIVVTHGIRAALSIGDVVWIMGRDHDASGKVCSGGKIMQELDLAEHGLAWHPEVESQPEFIRLNTEINNMFHTL